MGQIYKDLTIPYADFKQNYLWLSPPRPLCILCKAWIYFSVSSNGTVVLKWDWSPLDLARIKKNDEEEVQIQLDRVKLGWRLLT